MLDLFKIIKYSNFDTFLRYLKYLNYSNVPKIKCIRKVKRFKCIEIVPKCHFGNATINKSLPLICLNPNKGYKRKVLTSSDLKMT